MSRKSVRLEVRLTPELYETLQKESASRGKSMGECVREAVGQYVAKGAARNQSALVRQIAELHAPVDAWDVMEQEIEAFMTSASPRETPSEEAPHKGRDAD